MKKLFSSTLLFSLLFLTACGSGPMTEEEQAAKYGLTVEAFREEKKAAARMNMDLDVHMKMLEEGHDMSGHDHDSH